MTITAITPAAFAEMPEAGALLASTSIAAGFPSPAADYFEGRIDLNKHLLIDATSTYLIRVAGDSMTGAGIYDGDEVVVDRSLTPVDGNVVVAVLDGELTLKRLRLDGRGGVRLMAENPDYPEIVIGELAELTVWAVATRCLHRLL